MTFDIVAILFALLGAALALPLTRSPIAGLTTRRTTCHGRGLTGAARP